MKLVEPASSVIYLRKSQEDKELEIIGEKETLARHKKRLLSVAEKQGLNITMIYEEILSGDSIEERPAMQKLIQDLLNRKYKNLLVVELQRLSRGSTKDQGIILEAIEISGTKIVTPDRTYDPTNEYDLEAIEFGLYMSRREYKFITKRMRAGLMQSVKEGNYLSPIAPFGYDIWKRGRNDRTLKPNEHADLVKQMFSWSGEENMGVGEIMKRLNAMGISTHRGGHWTRSTVRAILINPIYTGKVRWNKRNSQREYIEGKIELVHHMNTKEDTLLVEGKHPALIDDETFEKVQKNFQFHPPVETKKLNNILAGLIRCSKCGKTLKYIKANGNLKPRYSHREHPKCNTKSTKAHIIMSSIKETLNEKMNDFEIALDNFNSSGEIERYEKLKDSLEKELEKLIKKKNKLYDLFEDDVYSRAEFTERKFVIIDKMSKIKSEMENLIEPSENDFKIKAATIRNVIDTLDADNISTIKKNKLLKSVIKRIDYCHDGDSVELDIFFK